MAKGCRDNSILNPSHVATEEKRSMVQVNQVYVTQSEGRSSGACILMNGLSCSCLSSMAPVFSKKYWSIIFLWRKRALSISAFGYDTTFRCMSEAHYQTLLKASRSRGTRRYGTHPLMTTTVCSILRQNHTYGPWVTIHQEIPHTPNPALGIFGLSMRVLFREAETQHRP